MSNIVTIFKNIQETDTPFFRDVHKVLQRIKEGASQNLVQQIRKEQDKGKRNELKKQLPSICFSGKFNKRSDVSIQGHSGLICLDFDGYRKQRDLLEDKARFIKNKFVFSVFISPSGKGLKVLIKIPSETASHTSCFLALENYFKSEYFDKTSRNVSRVCYESFDPLISINDNSDIWEKTEDEEYKEMSVAKDSKTIPITSENKIIDILTKWWQKKYPMSEGQRNQHAFILAAAFNDFGISKTTASMVISSYKSKDFTLKEIDTLIKSAYSNTQNFNTRYYEDEEKINEIQQRLRSGESKKVIREELQESLGDSKTIESVLEKAEEDNSVKFWTTSNKGIVKVIPLIFKKFLQNNGYYKYCPEGQKNYVFVKVTNNLIDHTSEKEIKDFILNYLYDLEDMSIYNYFADQTRLFREDFLTLLKTIKIYFIEDTIDKSYLYYRNCAVEISKKQITQIDYLELDGYVWKDHVINRDYSPCAFLSSDFKKFVHNICDKNEDRILTMESTIGYLMHGYKDVSYCPAVVLNDEVISDTANGGTGKGIWLQGLGHMKKIVMIDGKAFDFKNSFPYQLVSADTQILCFDDVKKYFDFERLFSVVTEGLILEKKNKDAIKIPFNKSPKIAITTNYVIKGSGSSFVRRKWELELSQHYNNSHTPMDDFGKFLFGDWSEDDWCKFDNYMMYCVQLKLKRGLIQGEFVNIKLKQLITSTSEEFIEWCGLIKGSLQNDLLVVDEKTHVNPLYANFIEEYTDYGKFGKFKLSSNRFGKWLTSYCVYTQGLEPETNRDYQGRWFRIRPAHEANVQQKIDL